MNDNMCEIENIEISTTKGQNLDKLIDKVNTCVNKNSFKIPINLFKEKVENFSQTESLMKSEGTINIILIGDSGVGKSNLFSRYFQNKFEENFISTIGMDRQLKVIKFKNILYNVSISDTAGQERFRSIPMKYYQNADGVLILFDVTNKESYDNVNKWIEDIKKSGGNDKKCMYLIGNKIDINEREVTRDEGKHLADSLSLNYYEMSCKININIYEVVSRMIVDCLKNVMNNGDGFQLKNKKTKKKKSCC